MPTAADVQNNGIDIGETQARLLQKIEELTQYLIEQNKTIRELKTQLQERKN